jgi:eukaryotic-like serine/threonine-protein kinase
MLENIGRYKLEERIGEGAMADVYRAFDPRINRHLAIKLLKKDFVQDQEYSARFLQEAKAAGALSHPNIVTIYDIGETGGQPYIVMELLEGQPLDAMMLDQKRLKPEQIMDYGIQIAQALDYAHAMGVVHRDIKPSNIIVSKDARSTKLLDFGIARVSDTSGTLEVSQSTTQIGAMPGTPRYMSPEQALGQPIDGRSDLYALGVVLYELLTGKKAFSASSMAALMMQITQAEPEPISKFAPDTPVGLQFIIGKLLAKRPERRFLSGAQVAMALQREADALAIQNEETKRHRYLPLPLRVTLLMTTITALVLAASSWFTLREQNKAMQDLAITSGTAIANFVAKNTGTYMALEDWDQVSVFVKVASEDGNVDDMVVTDSKSIVRGARNERLEGKFYIPNGGQLIGNIGGMRVLETHGTEARRVFIFSRSVEYAGRRFGTVHVSLKQDKLVAASKLSQFLLLTLALVTLASVILVAYSVANMLTQPIKRLQSAMRDVAIGNLDFRISHSRKDEFGEAFDGFNRMATAVEDRIESALGFAQEPLDLPPPPVDTIARDNMVPFPVRVIRSTSKPPTG